jgi:hypothetical protein
MENFKVWKEIFGLIKEEIEWGKFQYVVRYIYIHNTFRDFVNKNVGYST